MRMWQGEIANAIYGFRLLYREAEYEINIGTFVFDCVIIYIYISLCNTVLRYRSVIPISVIIRYSWQILMCTICIVP